MVRTGLCVGSTYNDIMINHISLKFHMACLLFSDVARNNITERPLESHTEGRGTLEYYQCILILFSVWNITQ